MSSYSRAYWKSTSKHALTFIQLGTSRDFTTSDVLNMIYKHGCYRYRNSSARSDCLHLGQDHHQDARS